MQFSQVMFVLILELMEALTLQNYYVCMCPILYPMKTSVLKGVQKWNIGGKWLISLNKLRSVIFTIF